MLRFHLKSPSPKGRGSEYSPCEGKFDTSPGEDKEVTIPRSPCLFYLSIVRLPHLSNLDAHITPLQPCTPNLLVLTYSSHRCTLSASPSCMLSFSGRTDTCSTPGWQLWQEPSKGGRMRKAKRGIKRQRASIKTTRVVREGSVCRP